MKSHPVTTKPRLTDLQAWKWLILLQKSALCYGFISILLLLGACQKSEPPTTEDDTFFERQNAAHNGDYLATYPLANPDSCIARLKMEVPAKLQPWACLSLWYHLPATSPPVATYLEFLDLWEKNFPHDTVKAFVQLLRGEVYVDLAQFDSARLCLADAHDRYLRLRRPLDASDAIYLKARSYLYQNNYAAALNADFEVLDLLDAHDTTFSQRHADVFTGIAIAYGRSENKPENLFWLKKAWNAKHDHLERPWLFKTRTAHNLSNYYLNNDDADSSLLWANKALEIKAADKKDETWPPKARLQLALGRALLKKEKCSIALPYLLEAYRQKPEQNNLFAHHQYSLSLGECYLCVGKPDSAELYVRQSLASPDTGSLALSQNLLRDIHVRRGNWENALAAANESRRLSEIKLDNDKAKAVADADARYETAQKETRIAQLEQQRKSAWQQNLIVALSLLLLLGLALSLFFRQRASRRIIEQEKELLAQEKSLLLREKELSEANALLKIQALEKSETELAQSAKELALTRTELGTTTRELVLKNQLIEELNLRLGNRWLAPGDASQPDENQSLRSMKILTKEDWEEFQKQFEQHFRGFLSELKLRFPVLTSAEIRMFLLVKLGFNRQEISETLGISLDSVWRSRYRLSKKLGLEDTLALNEFVRGFGLQSA